MTPADAEDFSRFALPGFVLMAMAFRVTPVDGGVRVATGTRVRPTDAQAARAFARYWRVIRPGSALIRLELLQAIKRRAERAA